MARTQGRPGWIGRLPMPSRGEAVVMASLLLIAVILAGASAWYASKREPPAYDLPASDAGSAAPTSDPSPRTPVLAFYGDSYVSGTDQGGVGPSGWPALVSQRVGATPTPVHAVPGAGYVAAAPSTGDTYVSLAQQAPEPEADVTIVFGTRNDYLATQSAIYAAATETFRSIRTAAPGTRLLVIGPAWTDAAVPSQLPGVRDVVQRAATDVGAAFVDPLAERWFFGTPELIGADIINPTDAGHVYLADRIEPALRELLAEVPGTEPAVASPTTAG